MKQILKIVLLDKKLYGKDSFKDYIRYGDKGNGFSSPLCIKLPQMSGQYKYFDKNSK